MARAARPYQPARPGSHGLDRLPPSPYPTMGSPVCGLTGLHWYNASSLSERHAWFTGSGLTGLREYTPLHSSRCSHGLRRLPPLPIHGFTNHTVYTSDMVDMACTVHTGNMTPRSCWHPQEQRFWSRARREPESPFCNPLHAPQLRIVYRRLT